MNRRLAEIVAWALGRDAPPAAGDPPLPVPRLLKSGKRKLLHAVDLPSGSFFLKQYRRLPPARWWQAGREARLMERARRRGLPVLLPDAALSRRTWGALLFRVLPGARVLQEVLLEPPGPGAEARRERRRLLARYGQFCRAVHEAGVDQYDFNPTNVLLGPGGELYLIDFERVRLRRRLSRAHRLRQLARMHRFPGASRAGRLRFLMAYLAPGERGEWKAAAREILALHRKKRRETAGRAALRAVGHHRRDSTRLVTKPPDAGPPEQCSLL